MPEPDLDLLVSAIEDAGQIALSYFGKSPEIWDKGDNQGPVTEADLAVNAMLDEELKAARPGYGWLSEETEDDLTRTDRDRIFVVDPIDGTRAFIDGRPHFSIVAAVVERGSVISAAIHLPALEETFAASVDGGATLNGTPISVSPKTDQTGATVLAAKSNFKQDFWQRDVSDLKPAFRSSLAYRLALVADGRFDAALTFRDAWEWDIAAGALIVAEAGGTVTDMYGGQLRFNGNPPQVPGIIAAGPPLHARLLAARTGTG